MEEKLVELLPKPAIEDTDRLAELTEPTLFSVNGRVSMGAKNGEERFQGLEE